VDTVPLALYCAQFVVEQPLETVIAQAIEVGGDTDTIASIPGQVAGTAAGVVSDYERYFSTVTEGDEAIRIGQRFADFVCELEKSAVRTGA
jgi:ADP-ribosylglycohydrolase